MISNVLTLYFLGIVIYKTFFIEDEIETITVMTGSYIVIALVNIIGMVFGI